MQLKKLAATATAGTILALGLTAATSPSASASTFAGTDPYKYVNGIRCADDARVVNGSDPILADPTNSVGIVTLYWSPRCQTNWAHAAFSTGSTGTVRLYFNGTLKESAPIASTTWSKAWTYQWYGANLTAKACATVTTRGVTGKGCATEF